MGGGVSLVVVTAGNISYSPRGMLIVPTSAYADVFIRNNTTKNSAAATKNIQEGFI